MIIFMLENTIFKYVIKFCYKNTIKNNNFLRLNLKFI